MAERAPIVRLYADELIIDSFAGGGGTSEGIKQAIGRDPDYAVNHDAEALSMHAVNHPDTVHLCEDVWKVNLAKVVAGRPVGLYWLSPDCKHHSKAKGGKPVEKKIRGLAWVAVRDAKLIRPRVIGLENVEEFSDWGPLDADNRPDKLKKGLTFRRFVKQLQNLGYEVDWQELVAADYGAPTTRKRLFLIARCDGQPIVWPEPTHAKDGKGGLLPWRAAAECIDWSLPCPSIFERARPLAENTLRRIAKGIRKYVTECANPFIVPVSHAGDSRAHGIDEPLRTVTGAHRGEHALIQPFIAGVGGRMGQSPERSVERPMQTITAKGDAALLTPYMVRCAHGEESASGRRWGNGEHSLAAPVPTVTGSNDYAIVAPTLITQGYGERPGQAPRVPGLDKPLGTLVGTSHHALVSAFLAKHYGDTGQRPGVPMTEPAATITASDHHAVVASSLVKMRGTNTGQANTEPLQTLSAQGTHFAEVRAFLMKYHTTGGQLNSLFEPCPTAVAKDSIGLVTVAGTQYAIVDIGMRMLQPRELFRAQGFPESYVIDRNAEGKPLTKSAQVRLCGNSVCPPVAAALIRANFTEVALEAAA